MNDNEHGVESANVPLIASVARRIIEDLFREKNQWKRAELAEAVERIHLERGGIKGKQEPAMIVKKALSALEEDGKVESPAYGYWRWVASESVPLTSELNEGGLLPSDSTLADNKEDEEIIIERQIGEGPERVYMYYNPNDRKLAELQGRDTWECKIGQTGNEEVLARILGQGAKTALSRFPVVGLVIRTQDSAALEKALHSSLRILECEVEDGPGSEWFMTSPAYVEAWYTGFQEALLRLRGRELEPD